MDLSKYHDTCFMGFCVNILNIQLFIRSNAYLANILSKFTLRNYNYSLIHILSIAAILRTNISYWVSKMLPFYLLLSSYNYLRA